MSRISRINNINFFRMFFVLIVIYGHVIQNHLIPIYGDIPFFKIISNHFSYAYGYACDMFFIISGFFMCFSFEKNQGFIDFIKSKIIRFYPVMVFSLLTVWILSLIYPDIRWFKYNNLLDLFFLEGAFVINVSTNNLVAWYVNVLFWTYIFYYCIIQVFPKEKLKYLIGIIIFFTYSILLNKRYLYDQPRAYLDGFLTFYMLRGIAGVGLGYLIGVWYKGRENKDISSTGNKWSRFLFFLLELSIIILIFRFATYVRVDFNFSYMTILFVILFVLFLTKKGDLSIDLDNSFIFNIGKYCFSIYMMQEVVFLVLRRTLWKNSSFVSNHPLLVIIISLIIPTVVGIVTYYAIEKPIGKFLRKRYLPD